MRYSVSRAAVAAAFLACPGAGFAAETSSDEEVIVTASRAPAGIPRDQLGASVTVVDPVDLQLRQTRLISDLLRDIPGVSVARSGAVGGLTQIRIRGTEANHTLVLIDGIEVSDPFQGEFDFASLIADEVARVEVLRGQQSALYGSDAIGGVINYLTLSGSDAPGVRGRVEGGSFGTYEVSVRAAGSDDRFDYALNGTVQNTDGVPTARFGSRDVGAEIAAASGRLSYRVTDELTIRAAGRYSHTNAESNGTDFVWGSPTYGFVVDTDDYYTYEALYGLVAADLTLLGGAWTHTLSLQGVDAVRDNFAFDAFNYGSEGSRVKGSYVTAYRFGSDALQHTLTGALDYERENFRNVAPYLTGEQSRERHIENVGLVAQYDLLIGDSIGIGAAVRHDDNDRFDNATTYRIQGSYLFESGTRLHAAAGSGIKNPGIFELFGYDPDTFIGDPNLKPERSTGWETGIEQLFMDGRARLDVTYFDSELRDEVYTNFVCDAVFNCVSVPVNLATTSKQKGVEVSAEALLGDAWRVFISYTYLDAEENGVEEVRRPRHSGSFNLSYVDPDDRFSGTLTVRYKGETTDNFFGALGSETVELPDYTLVNLAADVRVTDSVRVYARVENVFDEDYEDVFTYATAGRAAYAGVRAGF